MELRELDEMVRVAHRLDRLGYSEASAGNLSRRVRDDAGGNPPAEATPLPRPYPILGGMRFLITTRGSRMRDLVREPVACCGLFEVVPGGGELRCLWGNPRLSTEWSAHLGVHEALALAGKPCGALLHTHPPHLVALTQLPDLQTEAALNEELFRMHHETRIFLPERVTYVPYLPPGSAELGHATGSAALRSRVVLWDKHGASAWGPDLEAALDLLEMCEKAATIALLVRATGAKAVGLPLV